MNREKYISYINEKLSVLIVQIENYGILNISIINIVSEDFFCELFNILFDLNLQNVNFNCSNYVSIDLKDEQKKIAIQITSNNSKAKYIETVNKFISNRLSEKFEKLYIYNITKKKKHKEEIIKIGDNTYFNSRNHILDREDLIKRINSLPIDKLNDLHIYFQKNFEKNYENEKNNNKFENCKEVNTFLSIIEVLSDDENYIECNTYSEKPDPEYKIYNRFSDHSHFIISTYTSLFILYEGIYKSLEDNFQISSNKQRKMEIFLRTISNQILIDSNNNPQLAFNNLTDFFIEKLTKKNVEYDDGAIRFSLIKQLIACNVFPQEAFIQQALI
ncbi:SMEK domain-containing protein [Acinetobacter sp. yr461]|uniref:SMEK domain-containing protein n=1 Tax=Acinetobacter sp. yr461 TaxID=1761742 RepID=UPI0008AF2EC9|nr:SMEK domain-containing protein [Acinetobacter sp. yr461]SEO13039.1 hypothetical protein SAMN04487817_101545 [Acinetobacter sp. yr461]